MMHRFFAKVFFLSCLFLGAQDMAHAKLSEDDVSNIKHLFLLIDARFQLQKEASAFKYVENMPSYMPGREQQILAELRPRVTANNLDLQEVQSFFHLMMRTSVDLQNKWQQHWLRHEFPDNYPLRELQAHIRPELDKLSQEIVDQIGLTAMIFSQPEHFKEISGLFHESIEDDFITMNQRKALIQALVRIKKV